MAQLADRGFLEVWYDYVTVEDVRARGGLSQVELDRRVQRFTKRAQRKTSLQAVRKLTIVTDGRRRIASDPPVVFPLRDLPAEYDADVLEAAALVPSMRTRRRSR